MHAPAHLSQESDSEHRAKVATKSRNHSIFSHIPKDRGCDVCLRTKISKASWRRCTGDALPRAEKFGDLITADHKVPNDGVNPQTITGTLSWYKILLLNGFNPIRAKQNLHMILKKTYSKIEAIAQTECCIHRQLDGIWESPHRSETNGISERAVRRVKEGTSPVLLQYGIDERKWSVSMECY